MFVLENSKRDSRFNHQLVNVYAARAGSKHDCVFARNKINRYYYIAEVVVSNAVLHIILGKIIQSVKLFIFKRNCAVVDGKGRRALCAQIYFGNFLSFHEPTEEAILSVIVTFSAASAALNLQVIVCPALASLPPK